MIEIYFHSTSGLDSVFRQLSCLARTITTMPVPPAEQEFSLVRQLQPFKKHRHRRQAYNAAFKLKVVREALQRPVCSRIKPTCRDYPDIEPVRPQHCPIPIPQACPPRSDHLQRRSRFLHIFYRCNFASGSETLQLSRRLPRLPSALQLVAVATAPIRIPHHH